MNYPDLSVIICTYNRCESLKTVLEDLKKQRFPEKRFPWEVLVVDNNSRDGTRGLAEGCAASGELPLRYIFEPVQGKSFAINTAILAARGDLLAFTDDDVVLDEHWLSSVYRAFSDYPYDCFGGKVLPILEAPLPPWLSADDKKYQMMAGPIVSHDRGDEIKAYDDTMWVPIGANTFVRKRVFEKVGYYNTQLGLLSREALICGEDSEMMFRIKNAGETILYYPKALVYHPAPADRMKKSYFKKWFWGSGRGETRWQTVGPNGVRYLNVPRYLFRELGEEFLRWIITLPGRKEYKKFYHEMHFLYKLGVIYEYYMEGD